jgi:N-hydroxyarylamine O-acetyltransferase
MTEVDLKSYFARIGYLGDRSPTLETLQALHRLHPAAIPFENLDPLMKRPVHLELNALISKLVDQERGGYCYEQNTLFVNVLRTLGYSVSTLSARVQWNTPVGVVRPRTHMVLRTELPEGQYIADVGFGLLTLTAPLLLAPEIEQRTPHGLHRLVRVGDEFQLQVKLVEGWAPIYQLSLQEQVASDWEVANWFNSTHPASIFVNSLIAARPIGDLRYALLNYRLSIHQPNGAIKRSMVRGPSELTSVLEKYFGIRLPVGCDDVLTSVAQG